MLLILEMDHFLALSSRSAVASRNMLIIMAMIVVVKSADKLNIVLHIITEPSRLNRMLLLGLLINHQSKKFYGHGPIPIVTSFRYRGI